MTDAILSDARARMKKSLEALRQEMAKLRTGRASTALLDHLRVDYYGNPTPLNQVANVTVSDARTLMVNPWERSMVPVVEKAILECDLGLNPVTAGETIRIPLPPLTEDRRREMTRLVRAEGENGKVAVRNIRRDAIHQVREQLKSKQIGEDQERQFETRVQSLTDDYIGQVDALVTAKEAEIMEV